MAATSAGVSPSDFWRMTPAELKACADGYSRMFNRLAWLNGIYVQFTLTTVLSAILSGKNKNPAKYPSEPLLALQAQTEEEKQKIAENERIRARAYLMQMTHAWNKKFKADMERKKAGGGEDS